MSDSLGLTKEHDRLVVLSSGGCVFDSFGPRVRYAFVPAAVEVFGFSPIADAVREVFEWVYVCSPSRGINRFPVLVEVLEELAQRQDVREAGFELPDHQALTTWIEKEQVLSAAKLEERLQAGEDPFLRQVLDWSKKVNARIPDIAEQADPFQGVLRALDAMHGNADIVVFSALPKAAEEAVWRKHHLDGWLMAIIGQEQGFKREILERLIALGYPEGHVLVIGDKPGDFRAVEDHGVLFYPILAEKEGESWTRMVDQAWDLFLSGEFPEHQELYLQDFALALPDVPPWRTPEV